MVVCMPQRHQIDMTLKSYCTCDLCQIGVDELDTLYGQGQATILLVNNSIVCDVRT